MRTQGAVRHQRCWCSARAREVMRPEGLRRATRGAAGDKRRARGVFRTRLASEIVPHADGRLGPRLRRGPDPRRPYDVIAVPGGRSGERQARRGPHAAARWLTGSAACDAERGHRCSLRPGRGPHGQACPARPACLGGVRAWRGDRRDHPRWHRLAARAWRFLADLFGCSGIYLPGRPEDGASPVASSAHRSILTRPPGRAAPGWPAAPRGSALASWLSDWCSWRRQVEGSGRWSFGADRAAVRLARSLTPEPGNLSCACY
jgi:hypothetical protein